MHLLASPPVLCHQVFSSCSNNAFFFLVWQPSMVQVLLVTIMCKHGSTVIAASSLDFVLENACTVMLSLACTNNCLFTFYLLSVN